ncbi:hypothetical protein Tco_0635039, partial [Tanacetum coccineum]
MVRSSSHVSIVPSFSSSSHVFASLVSDRGNIIKWTASFSVSLYYIIYSEEFMNVFVRIGFDSTIELVSFDKSQVVTFNGKFVCGFRNGDCGIGSRSDNTFGSPHGFIIHGIKILKGNKKVTEVIDIKNRSVNNFWLCKWFVSLFKWNSHVSSMKSSIQSTFRFRTMPTATRTGMTLVAIEEMIKRRLTKALEAYEANKNRGPAVESGDEREDGNRDGNGNGNGDRGNGNGNLDMNVGVVGLTRWFEKIKIVYHMSNCPQKYQVKYASCTLQNDALTWWNSHNRTVGTDVAYAMSWKALMKLITEMVPKEEDRVEKFIGGLPANIQGNVIADEPTRLQDAI